MATLESEPSLIVASVLPDVKGMLRPSSGTVTIGQTTAGAPKGKTTLEYTYTEPDLSEPWVEQVEIDGGGSPAKDLEGTPINALSLTAFKATAFGGGGNGDTLVDVGGIVSGDIIVTVLDTTNFAAGDYARLLGADVEIAQIKTVISSTQLEFTSPLFFAYGGGDAVQEVVYVPLVVNAGGSDVTVDLSTGVITVDDVVDVPPGATLFFVYQQEGFFGSMRLFAVRRDSGFVTGDHYRLVSLDPDFVLLSSPGAGSSPALALFPVDTDNGKDYMMGMAAADTGGNVGPCAFLSGGTGTTVPDVPQNLRVTDVQVNPPSIKMEWDPATAGHKTPIAHKIYRNIGDVVDPPGRTLAGVATLNEFTDTDANGLVAGNDYTFSVTRTIPGAPAVVQGRRIQASGQSAQDGQAIFPV